MVKVDATLAGDISLVKVDALIGCCSCGSSGGGGGNNTAVATAPGEGEGVEGGIVAGSERDWQG